jgi:hypothetical protein
MRNVLAAMAVMCCGVVPVQAADGPAAAPSRMPPATLRSLYASYTALSVIDVQTTRIALRSGFHEANPLMSPIANHSAALFAVKGASAAATIYLTEHLRPRHPAMAVAAIVAANAISGFVVTRNAMTISRGATGTRAR